MFIALLIILGTLIMMEAISWFFHKYIMHGALWFIHKTHHQHTNSKFELNDIFSLFFASIAIVLIIAGSANSDYRYWMGWGITLYGFLYFIFHDIIIHKRIKISKKPRWNYLKSISKAHSDHHKTLNKKDTLSYGLFVVPKKYFRKN
jgi:beta-carotene 3-hydroxylase